MPARERVEFRRGELIASLLVGAAIFMAAGFHIGATVADDEALCPYPSHRSSDWRLRAEGGEPPGKWVCGICHPPAKPVEGRVERSRDHAK